MSTENKSSSILSRVKSSASIAQSVFAVIAIISTGTWLLVQREAVLKANITHEVTHRQINDNWTWLRVSIVISNPGKRLLDLESGIIRVQKVLPLDSKIQNMFDRNENPVSGEYYKVPWPRIGKSYEPKFDVKIEPGEEDNQDYEFIIPSYVKTVKVYSYFAKQESPPIGWKESTIYDITRN
jgi:hypothetical protein